MIRQSTLRWSANFTWLALCLCLLARLAAAAPLSEAERREWTNARSLAESYNALGFDVLAKLASAQSNQNIIISPAGLGSVLSMAQLGAREQTHKEISKVLHVEESANVAELNRQFLKYLFGNRPSSGITFESANSIWLKQGFNANPAYIETNRGFLNAEVLTADLSSASIVQEINKWAATHTHDKIPQEISSPFDRSTSMLLFNATYFKANWAFHFDPKLTQPDSFKLSVGKEIKHPRMKIEFPDDSVCYCENSRFQAIRLPYVANFNKTPAEMIVFLPKHSMTKFLQDFSAKDLEFYSLEGGTLGLPRFKLEQQYDLSATLASLGMSGAFDPELANFKGICDSRSLSVSQARQRTCFEVNEQGTEAATLTSVVMNTIGLAHAPPPPPKRFKMIVDRPFCVAIVTPLNAVLFLGVIMDPR